MKDSLQTHIFSSVPHPHQESISNMAWSPKMIVFDKDGTLGDCTQALHTWSKRMTKCIIDECERTNLHPNEIEKLIAQFHHEIGWNPVKGILLPSSYLSSGTWEQILEATALIVEKHANGCIVNIREKVVCWNRNLGDIHINDKALVDDLPGLMSYLRDQYKGLAIAICTSDDRRATNACIKNWKIEDHIDFSICGDEVSVAKPSPQPLLALCKLAQVSPEDCVVVGDTSADTGMGKNANAGLTVGVLTGTGTAEYLLDSGADVVIPSIDYLTGVITSTSAKMVECQSSSNLTAITYNSVSEESGSEGE